MSLGVVMSTELLNWVYRYLEQDEDIVVPIRRIWNDWQALYPEPPLAEFTALILADDRFEEMGAVDHTEGLEWVSPTEKAGYIRDMEAMGFYSGPRLKLASRQLTLEYITRMITRHNDRLELALRQVHAAMPDDVSEEEEGQLIDIMAQVEELREHLRQAGLETLE
jgi:hypothetical protein